MFSNRFTGLFVGVLASALVATGGCRSRTQDRLRILEAERAELQRQNSSLKSDLANKSARESELLAERDRAQAELSMMRGSQASSAPAAPSEGGEESLRDRLRNELGSDVKVGGTGDRPTITLASDVTFASGRAELSASAKQTLAKAARVLANRGDLLQIRVEGHTDSDPIRRSGWASNTALSEARAETVKRYLVAQGIPEELLATHGYGEDQPLVPNDTKENKARNRRVEIAIVTR